MSLDFTAIDFETANGGDASVCAVGMAKVRDGRVVDSVSWLIQPPSGLDSFAPMNVKIHGISPKMAALGDTWEDADQRIRDFIGDDVIVAYNAPFDRGVWDSSSMFTGARPAPNTWLCALVLSRALLTLGRYKLPDVADHLGIAGLKHHDAASDAKVCAQIVVALAESLDAGDIQSLWGNVPVKPPKPEGNPNLVKYYSKGYSATKSDLPQPSPNADPSLPFYGHLVIFTGGLEQLDRWTAMELVALHGGHNGLGVTLKTTMLVIGDGEDPYAPGFDLATGTSKQQKAHKYITERGKSIQVLSEEDFYALVRAVGHQPSVGELSDQGDVDIWVEAERPVAQPPTIEPSAPAIELVPEPAAAPVLTTQPAPVPVEPDQTTPPTEAPDPFVNPYASAPPPADRAATEVGSLVPALPMKRRNGFVRVLLKTLAIILLIIGGFSLLFLVVALAMREGPEIWVTFAVFALLFGGGGVLVLRAARRR